MIIVYGFHVYHALVKGEKKTLCGAHIRNMEYQGKDLKDIECKKCLKVLKAHYLSH